MYRYCFTILSFGFLASCSGAQDASGGNRNQPSSLPASDREGASSGSEVMPLVAATPAAGAGPVFTKIDGVDGLQIKAGLPETKTGMFARANTPALTTSWEAAGNHAAVTGVSADTNIAVSPTRVVVTTRDAIAWYTKGGRAIVSPTNMETFFNLPALGLPSGTANHYHNDCRSLYDEYRGRFFVLCLYHSPLITPQARLLVAVSRTGYPESGWNQYVFNGASVAPGANPSANDDTDYVSIGVDSQAFYTAGGVDSSGTFKYTLITITSADDLANGVAAASVRRAEYFNWTQPDGSIASGVIHPATHHGSTNTGYFVSRYVRPNVPNNDVLVWGITDPLNAATRVVRRATVTMQASATAPSPLYQSPGVFSAQSLWTDATRNWPISAEWRNNKLYFTNNDTISCGFLVSRPGVHFGRLNTTNFVTSSSVSIERDRIFGCQSSGETDTFEYAWGAVGVNAAGDAALVYNRSNAAHFAELRASAFYAADSDISPSTLMKAGEATYFEPGQPVPGTVAWADLSGASVDPSDNTAVWLAGCYPKTPPSPQTIPNFQIWVGKLFGSQRADLAPIALVPSSYDPSRGTSYTFNLLNENQGDGANASATSRVYLSTDNVISTSDTLLTTITTPAMAGGAAAWNFSVPFTIPTSVAPGTYYLGVCLDTGNTVSEYSDSNNCQGPTAELSPSAQITVR